MRTALQPYGAPLPDQQGQPVQHPTARWVFHYVVGMHGLRSPGQWDSLVAHLTAEHQSLLRLLGKPSARWSCASDQRA